MTKLIQIRINDYLLNYTTGLVLLSIIGNFGAAVQFVQSKLFLNGFFNFSLTKNENYRLSIWKFLNTTLLEV